MDNLLTLTMIVKNEEVFLAQCLESVKNVVDDMIIVDTGSSDRTVAIAREYGATVIEIAWPNDFAKARNVGLEQVKTPWVLVMDADEVLVEDDIAQLTSELHDPKADAYNLRIVSLTNKADQISESYVTRLFRSHPKVRFSGAIHEQIIPSLQPLKFRVGPLNVRLIHYGYMDGVSQERDKGTRNRLLLEDAVKKEPDSYYLHWQLCQTYLGLGMGPEAIREGKKTLALLSVTEPLWPLAQISLAKAYLITKQPKKALRILQETFLAHPRYTDARYMEGLIYRSLNDFVQAKKAFEDCLSLGEPEGFLFTETGVGGFKSLFQLAQVLINLNEPKQAAATILMAIKIQPGFRESWNLLFSILSGTEIGAVGETLRLVVSPETIVSTFKVWPVLTEDEEHLLAWAKEQLSPKN